MVSLTQNLLQLLEDEGSADDDFWNQDFFAEEQQGDVEYNSSNASEAEEPDVPDTDFDESVCSAPLQPVEELFQALV